MPTDVSTISHPCDIFGRSHVVAKARQEAALAIAFSIGIGLTNECNLRCAHCNRPDMVLERLTRSDVRRVCDAVTAGSMNLGVGENGLHSEYQGILDDLAARGTLIVYSVVFAVALSAIADLVGLATIIGAFAAGVGLPAPAAGAGHSG